MDDNTLHRKLSSNFLAVFGLGKKGFCQQMFHYFPISDTSFIFDCFAVYYKVNMNKDEVRMNVYVDKCERQVRLRE